MTIEISSEPSSAGTKPLRTLVVEGDPVNGTRLANLLSGGARRHTVDSARSVDAALRRLAEERFEAVLLSLSPKTGCESPVEAVRRLVEAARGAPVLVLSGRSDTRLGQELTQAGAAQWLAYEDAFAAESLLLGRAVKWSRERRDLSEALERSSENRLRAAYQDPLTELPNQTFFRQHLRSLLAQSDRNSRMLAVLLLDVDRFKPINDTFGHAAGGDLLLRALARRIGACLRKGDVVARKGGDEYLVILDGIQRSQDVARVARKILSEIRRPIVFGTEHAEGPAGASSQGTRVSLTASLGIALAPGDGGDEEKLIKHAEMAMYQVKRRGGDDHQFFQPDMNDSALARLELEHNLRLALERKEFVLHYQPQFDLSRNRICGFEALVRWQHPERGMIPPDQFIPVAEETGLIDPLGDWVLETACLQNREWQDSGLTAVPISVNFSARQFHDNRPAERVGRALRRTGLEPRYLDLELTESVVMENADQANATLTQLRDLGIGISIDDFGTGHSSLGYLKRFPINRLKIDKTFIRTLLEDPRDAAITEAIIAMAHSLDMRAVAEGVETREQLDYLRAPGCDEVQGYLLSRPVPAEEAGLLLAAERRN